MKELILVYEYEQWTVQVLNEDNKTSGFILQFQYFICPSPLNPNFGFIIEQYTDNTPSRILYYDLSVCQNKLDGSYKHAKIAELSRFKANTETDLRIAAGYQLPEAQHIQAIQHWNDLCHFNFPQPQELTYLTLEQYIEARVELKLLENQKQITEYKLYIEQQRANEVESTDNFQAAIDISKMLSDAYSEYCKNNNISEKISPNPIVAIIQKEEEEFLAVLPKPKVSKIKAERKVELSLEEQLLAAKNTLITLSNQSNLDLRRLATFIDHTPAFKKANLAQLTQMFKDINLATRICEFLVYGYASGKNKNLPLAIALLTKVSTMSNEEYAQAKSPQNFVSTISNIHNLPKYATAEIASLKGQIIEKHKLYQEKKLQLAQKLLAIQSQTQEPINPKQQLTYNLAHLNSTAINNIVKEHKGLQDLLQEYLINNLYVTDDNFQKIKQFIIDLKLRLEFCQDGLINPKIADPLKACFLEKMLGDEKIDFLFYFEPLLPRLSFIKLMQRMQEDYPTIATKYLEQYTQAKDILTKELSLSTKNSNKLSDLINKCHKLNLSDDIVIDGKNMLLYAIEKYPDEICLDILAQASNKLIRGLDQSQNTLLHLAIRFKSQNLQLIINILQKYSKATSQNMYYLLIANSQKQTFIDILLAMNISNQARQDILLQTYSAYNKKTEVLEAIANKLNTEQLNGFLIMSQGINTTPSKEIVQIIQQHYKNQILQEPKLIEKLIQNNLTKYLAALLVGKVCIIDENMLIDAAKQKNVKLVTLKNLLDNLQEPLSADAKNELINASLFTHRDLEKFKFFIKNGANPTEAKVLSKNLQENFETDFIPLLIMRAKNANLFSSSEVCQIIEAMIATPQYATKILTHHAVNDPREFLTSLKDLINYYTNVLLTSILVFRNATGEDLEHFTKIFEYLTPDALYVPYEIFDFAFSNFVSSPVIKTMLERLYAITLNDDKVTFEIMMRSHISNNKNQYEHCLAQSAKGSRENQQYYKSLCKLFEKYTPKYAASNTAESEEIEQYFTIAYKLILSFDADNINSYLSSLGAKKSNSAKMQNIINTLMTILARRIHLAGLQVGEKSELLNSFIKKLKFNDKQPLMLLKIKNIYSPLTLRAIECTIENGLFANYSAEEQNSIFKYLTIIKLNGFDVEKVEELILKLTAITSFKTPSKNLRQLTI